jgi:hypothetical protein
MVRGRLPEMTQRCANMPLNPPDPDLSLSHPGTRLFQTYERLSLPHAHLIAYLVLSQTFFFMHLRPTYKYSIASCL